MNFSKQAVATLTFPSGTRTMIVSTTSPLNVSISRTDLANFIPDGMVVTRLEPKLPLLFPGASPVPTSYSPDSTGTFLVSGGDYEVRIGSRPVGALNNFSCCSNSLHTFGSTFYIHTVGPSGDPSSQPRSINSCNFLYPYLSFSTHKQNFKKKSGNSGPTGIAFFDNILRGTEAKISNH